MKWDNKSLDAAQQAIAASTSWNEAVSKLAAALGKGCTWKAAKAALARHRSLSAIKLIGTGADKSEDLGKWPSVKSLDAWLDNEAKNGGSWVGAADVLAKDPEANVKKLHEEMEAARVELLKQSAASQAYIKEMQALAGDEGDDLPDFFDGIDDPEPEPGLKRILFIPDVHRPYHDEAAWQLALKCARAFKPDHLVILGDFGDFYCTSQHRKKPSPIRSMDLETEIASCNQGLDELDEAVGPQCLRKDFVEGNHEENLERYLADRAPELFNLITVKDQLGLDERGYHFTRFKDHIFVGKLMVTHCVEKSSGVQAHLKSQADVGTNLLIGHTHRMGLAHIENALGEAHVAGMFGWLGDKKMAEYMHRVSTRHWKHGIGIGYLEPCGNVHLVPVPFVQGKALIEGRLVQ